LVGCLASIVLSRCGGHPIASLIVVPLRLVIV
jgi:hypothetical protein